jgi:hypothetical protein
MDRITARFLSSIPERAPRMRSGAPLVLTGQPSQIAHLAQFLNWLAPLNPLAEKDQGTLGVLHLRSKIVDRDDDERDMEESIVPLRRT